MTRRTRSTTPEPETLSPGATQRIVVSITQAIIERRLMPGTKLVEQKLADIFGCSRTLVRQALNQLSRDRLVTLEPARGAFVAQPSVEEARQVFELRELLESALVRHLVTTITKDQVNMLRAHLVKEQAAVRAADVPGRTRLLADFHVLLARVAGNDVMGDLMADLLSRSSLISLMYQSAHSAEQSHAEHVALVDALARRDARAAVKLMAQHIHSVQNALCLDPQSIDLAAVLRPGP
ncbi:GntR family transcriptional regulator [Burkholderiaceae bacterium UC74_6]